MPRRSYGSGSLFETRGSWYGKWWVHGRQVKRKLGPVRQAGTRQGLTRVQAEAELRRRIGEEASLPAPAGLRPSLHEVGEKLIAHLESTGRKRSTTQQYDSCLREHIQPFFGDRDIARCQSPEDVERFLAYLRGKKIGPAGNQRRLARKTVLNNLGFLHSIFAYAQRKGWVTQNPCKLIEKPSRPAADADIRFLTVDEVWAVARATPDTPMGRLDRAIVLTAR